MDDDPRRNKPNSRHRDDYDYHHHSQNRSPLAPRDPYQHGAHHHYAGPSRPSQGSKENFGDHDTRADPRVHSRYGSVAPSVHSHAHRQYQHHPQAHSASQGHHRHGTHGSPESQRSGSGEDDEDDEDDERFKPARLPPDLLPHHDYSQAPRTRDLDDLWKIIGDMRKENIQLQQVFRQNLEDMQTLKRHADEPSQDEPVKRRKAAKSKSSGTRFRPLGKKFAVVGTIWLPAAVWLVPIPGDDGDAQPLDEEDAIQVTEHVMNCAMLLQEFLARDELMKKVWESASAKADILNGMRSTRSTFVFNVAQNPNVIFGIADARWADKKQRSRLPEVQALLKHQSFLYDPASKNFTPASHMRHPCILKALQMLLNGLQAAKTGRKASKIRPTNGSIWGLSEVTKEMLAFVATGIYAVLIAADSFIEFSGDTNFSKFYQRRIELLRAQENENIVSYKQLMHYYNSKVFRHKHVREEEDVPSDEEELLRAMRAAGKAPEGPDE